MVLYLASDLITRLTASRKGLFNFVVLFSHACNLQTAQSQTSVVNDTFYSSKFHFSGNLVTELRPTLNENISLFFSVASHIPYLFHLVSLLVSTGPPTIRASIHGLVINIIQSLCTCTCIKFSGESPWIWYFMTFFRSFLLFSLLHSCSLCRHVTLFLWGQRCVTKNSCVTDVLCSG